MPALELERVDCTQFFRLFSRVLSPLLKERDWNPSSLSLWPRRPWTLGTRLRLLGRVTRIHFQAPCICNSKHPVPSLPFHLLLVHYVKRKLWELLTSELTSFQNSENQDWSLKRKSPSMGARLKTETEYSKAAIMSSLCLIFVVLSALLLHTTPTVRDCRQMCRVKETFEVLLTFVRRENSDLITT